MKQTNVTRRQSSILALLLTSVMTSHSSAVITLTDTTNLTLANSQVESGADTSENPDVTGGLAGPLLNYTETGTNTFGCCGPAFGRQNLNDGDIGLGITSDGLYAIPDADGEPLVFSFGSEVTIKSIAIYNGYKNRDDGDYVLSDGSGNSIGAWSILTPPPGGGNAEVDSLWLTFDTPVVTDELRLSYAVADCCGTPSFREIQVFAPVPEPSHGVLLSLGGILFLARRSRR